MQPSSVQYSAPMLPTTSTKATNWPLDIVLWCGVIVQVYKVETIEYCIHTKAKMAFGLSVGRRALYSSVDVSPRTIMLR